MHFADQAFIAETTAKMLLEVKAVLFFEDRPFVFTSGWASPVYIDCRKLIFYPRLRVQLVDVAVATLARAGGVEQFDVVAGGETAGIAYAAWIAERLALPMQYVRKKPKGFGRNAQIEGDIREGARTLLVEDLTTDGRSKVNFCKALRDAGAVVDHVFVNFYYDIYPEAQKILADLNVRLHYLATWWDVLAVVKKCQEADLDAKLHGLKLFEACHAFAQKKGYSGVALYSRKTPDEIARGFRNREFDAEGRYVEARFGDLWVVSVYLPSGSAGPHRQASKFRFLKHFLRHLQKLRSRGQELILCG